MVQNNVEEEASNAIEPMKQVAQSLFAIMSCGQGGMIAEVPEPVGGLNNKENTMEGPSVSGLYETVGRSLNFKFQSPSLDEAVCSVCNKDQTLDKSAESGAEKQIFPVDCVECINEKTHMNISSKPSQNTELLRSHLH